MKKTIIKNEYSSPNSLIRNRSTKNSNITNLMNNRYFQPQNIIKTNYNNQFDYEYNNNLINIPTFYRKMNANLLTDNIVHNSNNYISERPEIKTRNIYSGDYHQKYHNINKINSINNINNNQENSIPFSLNQEINIKGNKYNTISKKNNISSPNNNRKVYNEKDVQKIKENIKGIKDMQNKMLSILEGLLFKDNINNSKNINNNNIHEESLYNKLKEENDLLKDEISILKKKEEENKNLIEQNQKEIKDLKKELKRLKVNKNEEVTKSDKKDIDIEKLIYKLINKLKDSEEKYKYSRLENNEFIKKQREEITNSPSTFLAKPVVFNSILLNSN